ncbi:MAG: SGNH/GDSL hydrolase family protein [Muribaculaceae bacterium]
MKKLTLSVLITAFAATQALCGLKFVDASQFRIIGTPTDATTIPYNRLPDSLEGKIREQLWDLGRNSAGIAIRFSSNTTTIGAKWDVWLNRSMNHMTQTGIRGLDLYTLQDDGTWTFVNSARPGSQASNTATIMSNMTAREREYMLFLPLYDGCHSIHIGIDSTATIGMPKVNLPTTSKPVVWYGTSITQGGCASRPGMAATNILERKLNRVIINLGFSGNGRLDPEIAEMMAAIDASVYILDCLPNVTTPQIKELTEKFYRILRGKRPKTPILMMENPEFPHTRFNGETRRLIEEKNATWHEFYVRFCNEGDKNLFFIPSKGMIGDDHEATVDCNHFTDLGFMRCADFMLPILQKFVK